MKILFLLCLVTTSILSVFAYEPKLVASIKIPSDLASYITEGGQIGIRSTLFIGRAHITFNSGGVSLIVDKDGRFVFARGNIDAESETKTNLLSTTIENGILKIIQEEIFTGQYFQDDGAVAFYTLSPDGYTSIKNVRFDTAKRVFKISANSKEAVSNDFQTSYKYYIEKFDKSGKLFTRKIYDGKYLIAGNFGQYPSLYPTPDFFVSTNIRNDIIDVYFIYPSSSQGNGNQINLNLKNISNTNIAGIIETSKTNTIKIQSSEDIKNWIDVQTVINPSGKTFSIPLIKPKEFIRAIE
jgi:hypothetical protein